VKLDLAKEIAAR